MKKFLRDVLRDTEILSLTADKDVYFVHATNAKTPYLEYQIIGEYGEAYAENKEVATNYTVQVDIFSVGDYTSLENKVKEKMIKAGFNRANGADLYEQETKLYHKAMRFTYTKSKTEKDGI